MQLLNIYLNHFPKHEKYALCNQIRNTAYEVYNLITYILNHNNNIVNQKISEKRGCYDH